jgi:hypothetical protein
MRDHRVCVLAVQGLGLDAMLTIEPPIDAVPRRA